MSVAPSPYTEIVDFIAGANPQALLAFCPSPQAQARFRELVEKERETSLTPEETSELDHCLELEHILRMAKAKARLILACG